MRSGKFLANVLASGGISLILTGGSIIAQTRNNPYSPSPGGRAASAQGSQTPGPENAVNFRLASDSPSKPVFDQQLVIAQTANRSLRTASTKSASPTEIYKIGIGDVLFVDLKNTPSGSGYFTVRADGTIDYPLAGDRVEVAEHTVEVAGEIIASGIKLFASPEVEVKVRQYGSHKITVTGAVESGGEKSLQREAMPLFAIRAEAAPDPKVSQVRIKRAGSSNEEVLDLRDAKSDGTLIYPGDRVHFVPGLDNSLGSYFIAGEVVAGGQKDLASGITLYQAVIAAGGTKGDPKKAVIRRKNENGTLGATEHNLRAIKGGKAADPALIAGDIVEIKN